MELDASTGRELKTDVTLLASKTRGFGSNFTLDVINYGALLVPGE